MAKPELGTKRLCASCGAKFYDLSKDPIVCPKCGTVYEVAAPVAPRGGRSEAARMTTESELPETTEAEFVSLEEADAEASGKKVTAGEDIADVDEDVDLDESLDDDAFIAEDEEEDTDVSEILGGDIEDEEET
ncbi:TIGR02300 family protein [Rhodoplanes elegans]|uniref:TIGR02300 family protein n=1 Tax=Rhodoplanes elegans TaxID=29408 RepID=A0A327K0N7_9BRAD|nr:TIGR02300 family protein [Rhodoplanes elegans]MBK5960866.1 TIGR02300 family protein [Rhodoplanes elegans]RAI31393.1 TIGR02300 family protein [Rhodoplanes elegans]